MSAKTVTSAISPVVIGSGRMKSTTYIATKVVGPVKDAAGNSVYTPTIVQYDSAAGGTAKTIGSRDPATGKITWNDNASGRTKLNTEKFKKASNNQMLSIENELTDNVSEKTGLNNASGSGNQEVSTNIGNSDTSSSTPSTFNDTSPGPPGPFPVRQRYNKNLCYPTTLRRNQQDTLRISVLKYRPSGFSGLTAGTRPPGKPIGSVTLPVPGGVQDGNKTSWGSGNMTPMQMATSGAVKAFLGEGGATGAMESAQASMNQAMANEGEDVQEALSSFFTKQLTGATDVLSRTTGQVMNPNMELLFKGPTLRTFGFTWKMSPRDERESMTILKIIRMFKQSMAPQKTDSQLFLKAPSTYKLEYISPRAAKTHRFLPKIKECALLDCGVNYTPDGSYMTYENSSMVSYEMSLSFQEIEPIYNNDMDSKDYDIGY